MRIEEQGVRGPAYTKRRGSKYSRGAEENKCRQIMYGEQGER